MGLLRPLELTLRTPAVSNEGGASSGVNNISWVRTQGGREADEGSGESTGRNGGLSGDGWQGGKACGHCRGGGEAGVMWESDGVGSAKGRR